MNYFVESLVNKLFVIMLIETLTLKLSRETGVQITEQSDANILVISMFQRETLTRYKNISSSSPRDVKIQEILQFIDVESFFFCNNAVITKGVRWRIVYIPKICRKQGVHKNTIWWSMKKFVLVAESLRECIHRTANLISFLLAVQFFPARICDLILIFFSSGFHRLTNRL